MVMKGGEKYVQKFLMEEDSLNCLREMHFTILSQEDSKLLGIHKHLY